MTFSLLVRDPATGAFGGAAATGSLCVGGWVLRGNLGAGLSASQGAAPSTFWGEDVLTRMAAGAVAEAALAAVTAPDPGRDWRQLACLDPLGRTAAHSGPQNGAARGHVCQTNRVASGNMLTSLDSLDGLLAAYEAATGPMSARLLAALIATQQDGGDQRGLKSAALLVLHPDCPPLSLRVDWSPDPLAALHDLHHRATTGDYAKWTHAVPVETDRHRADPQILDND
ncbi:MAG: DUF1028 domain-containing protein [bacterium]